MQFFVEWVFYQAVVKFVGYDSLIVDFQLEWKFFLNQVVFLIVVEEEIVNDVVVLEVFDLFESLEIFDQLKFEVELQVFVFVVEFSELVFGIFVFEEVEILVFELMFEQVLLVEIVFEFEMLVNVLEFVVDSGLEVVDIVFDGVESGYFIVYVLFYVIYLLIQWMSLWEVFNFSLGVIFCMLVYIELKLLEKINEWWWKVFMGGWDGYVKVALFKLWDQFLQFVLIVYFQEYNFQCK